jgi:hypothetical protein
MPNWLIYLTALIDWVRRRQAPIRQERFEIGGTRGTGCQPARPDIAAPRPASGGRGCAALAATRATGHEPHDDKDGHRDQPDDEKRIERSHDPARRRDGKPDSEDRAEDCPNDPAHVLSMPPGPAGSEPDAIIALQFPATVLLRIVVHGTIAALAARDAGATR